MKGDKIKYREGYKYQLAETYSIKIPITPDEDIVTEFITLTKEGLLTIENAYAWDGPSGPALDTKTAMRGSLVHDALYQLMRMRLLGQEMREVADCLYADICIKDKMSKARAWIHFNAISLFAGSAANPDNDRKILIAP